MQPTISHDRRAEVAWYLAGRDGRVVRSAVGVGLMLLGLAAGTVPAFVLVPLGAVVLVLALMNVCLVARYLNRVADDDGS